MCNEYLYGMLTIDYGIDAIFFVHKVQGRFSYLNLGKGDLIEVKENDEYHRVSVDEILETTTHKRKSKHHTDYHLGQSYYEGVKVRVKLNPKTTQSIKDKNVIESIKNLMLEVRTGEISPYEVERTLRIWEQQIEENESEI